MRVSILSLHDLHTECPACSREAVFNGTAEETPIGFVAEVTCPSGHGDFTRLRPEWATFLKRHLQLQRQDTGYREWSAALVSGDPTRILGFLDQLHTHMVSAAPPLAPFVRADWLPAEALTLAHDVVVVLLRYPAFVLPPEAIDRARESTVAALRRGSATDAEQTAVWISQHLGDAEWGDYRGSLPRVFGVASQGGENIGRFGRRNAGVNVMGVPMRRLLEEFIRGGRARDIGAAVQTWRKMMAGASAQFGEGFAADLFPWLDHLKDLSSG